MLLCLKDVVIHITYLDPFAGLHMTFGERDESVHISCNPIVLLCVYVLKVIQMCSCNYTSTITMFIMLL